MTDSELKQAALDHAERLILKSEEWAQLPGRTVVGYKFSFYRFMLARIKQALQKLYTEDERGVWYADNPRPRSYKFICSACLNVAYDMPRLRIDEKSGKYIKYCGLQYCPNCGIKMITLDTKSET